MKNKTIGEKLSPILKEISDSLWEFEANLPNNRPSYTKDGFHSAVKIFMSALLDKMWLYQEKRKIKQEDRELLAQVVGTEIRKIIKEATNIDTADYYK